MGLRSATFLILSLTCVVISVLSLACEWYFASLYSLVMANLLHSYGAWEYK